VRRLEINSALPPHGLTILIEPIELCGDLEPPKLIEPAFSHLSSIFAQGGHDYLSNTSTIALMYSTLTYTAKELVSRLTHGTKPNKEKEKAFPLMATVWLGH
jgi:hypothetical protein